MNCLNRYEIQKFIDNEVTETELKAFLEHKQNCEHCQKLFDLAKSETKTIKGLLSLGLVDNMVVIPEFKGRKRRNIRKKVFFYSAAAASILLMMGVYSVLNKTSPVELNKSKADILIDQYLYESDPNKIWTEKQSCITVTDENGEVVYSNLKN